MKTKPKGGTGPFSQWARFPDLTPCPKQWSLQPRWVWGWQSHIPVPTPVTPFQPIQEELLQEQPPRNPFLPCPVPLCLLWRTLCALPFLPLIPLISGLCLFWIHRRRLSVIKVFWWKISDSFLTLSTLESEAEICSFVFHEYWCMTSKKKKKKVSYNVA